MLTGFYLVLSLASFLAFCIASGLLDQNFRSAIFKAAIVLSTFLIGLVVSNQFFDWPISDNVSQLIWAGFLLLVISFVILLSACSVVIEAVRDLSLVQNGIERTLTLWAWLVLPAILALLAALAFHTTVERLVRTAFFSIEMQGDISCSVNPGHLLCPNDSLADSISELVERTATTASSQIVAETEAALASGADSGAELSAQSTDIIWDGDDPIIKRGLGDYSDSLRPPGCSGLGDWINRTGDCVARRVLKPLNQAYDTSRADARSAYLEADKNAGEASRESASATDRNVKIYSGRMIDQWRDSTLDFINGVVLVGTLLDVLWWLIVTRVLVNIAGAQLSRIVYNVQFGAVPLSLTVERESEARIKCRNIQSRKSEAIEDNAVSIALKKCNWIAIEKNMVSIARPGRALVRPFERTLGRLRHGQFWLRKFEYRDDQRELVFNFGAEIEIFQIEIPEGHKLVLIDQSRIVAYTEGMKFRRSFCPKLFSFLANRFMFLTVGGPGTILLASDRGGFAYPSKGDPSVPVHRLIAFDFDCKFKLRAENDWLSSWVLPPQVATIGKSVALSAGRDPPRVKRLARKILMILAPGL